MNQYLVLVVLWVSYCAAHSYLAAAAVKAYFKKAMGPAYRYYRPLYSAFALVTLIAVLCFQFSMQSIRIFNPFVYLIFPGLAAAATGLCIMIICINKYFYELSGLQAIRKPTATNTLQQSGLHRYVRHPLYLGTLLFIWGLFLIFPFISNLIAVVIITAYVLAGIRIEEKKLYSEYGESYREYEKRVPRLIPYLKYK